jgi:hypothetical protein
LNFDSSVSPAGPIRCMIAVSSSSIVPARPLWPSCFATSEEVRPYWAIIFVMPIVGAASLTMVWFRFCADWSADMPCDVISASAPATCGNVMPSFAALGSTEWIDPARSSIFILPWPTAATISDMYLPASPARAPTSFITVVRALPTDPRSAPSTAAP